MNEGGNGDLLRRLLATFRQEAKEHATALAAGLLELEQASGDARAAVLERVFREAHSFKGAARAVSLDAMESLCQAMENVFAALQRNRLEAGPALFDLLHEAVDLLRELSDASDPQSHPGKAAAPSLARRLAEAAAGSLPGRPGALSPGAPPAPSPVTPMLPTAPGPSASAASASSTAFSSAEETVRIATAKLDSLLFQAEDLFPVRLASDQLTGDLRELQGRASAWKRAWARASQDLRAVKTLLKEDAGTAPGRGRGAALARLREFMDWNQVFMESLDAGLAHARRSSERNHQALRGASDGLLKDVKKALTLPCMSVLEILPKLARDVARDQGKEIAFVIHGGEIEIDKRVLQEIKDALIHVVRNGIDHGIERPETRVAKGKPAAGTLSVTVTQHEGNSIEIAVADDGAGMDPDKVRAAAVKQGILSAAEAAALPDDQARQLIFRSGVSTSPLITDISGRGLGLAIVWEKMERVKGAVSVRSGPQGTVMRMTLPVTLAAFRGVVVSERGRRFAVPSSFLWKAARAKAAEIRSLENSEAVLFDGEAVSLVRLGDVLELPAVPAPPAPERAFPMVVLAVDGKRMAFRIDAILGEQELMVKGLGPQLARVRNVGGAAIVVSGEVIPVLNVQDLFVSAVRAARGKAPAQAPEARVQVKSILVVEDSITSRTLLKNLLEGAGYRVETAVDGMDALAKLGVGHFDAVVSDVDMPRLNGFDLTSRIRADKRISSLPVVLITSLDSRADYERGFAVGAQAYIVKSKFDQGNLVDIMKRLV